MSARAELIRALAAAAEPPTPALAAVADALGLPRLPTAAEHTDLFTFQLHPYASVHLGPEGQLGGIARDRIAGFLRALGVTPPTEPDHLVALLAAYAQLLDLDDGDDSRARHARTVLLHEHLTSWTFRFTTRVSELAGPVFARWASLLDRVLHDELAQLGAAPVLPAHLQAAPGLPSPDEEGTDAFIAGLLAPVRSGLVMARADVARIARTQGLGLRMGERAYMLRSLLDQDARTTLAALADEACRQAALVTGDDVVTDFWRARLTVTDRTLTELVAGDRRPASG